METNNLIAKFMELEYAPQDSRWDDWFDKDRYRVTFGNRIPLQYDTSWEWLMPVVEKIKDTGYGQELDNIDNVLTCDLTRENLYNAVVEFIKEYNNRIN